MGKYTKKRNCRKNKSMKKGGQYPNDDKEIQDRPVEKLESSTEAPPIAPSGSTTENTFSWTNPLSWFPKKDPPTTGGRKNKQRKSKSKSKK